MSLLGIDDWPITSAIAPSNNINVVMYNPLLINVLRTFLIRQASTLGRCEGASKETGIFQHLGDVLVVFLMPHNLILPKLGQSFGVYLRYSAVNMISILLSINVGVVVLNRNAILKLTVSLSISSR